MWVLVQARFRLSLCVDLRWRNWIELRSCAGGEQLATDTALPVVLDWLDRAAARGVRLVAFESGLCNRCVLANHLEIT